MNETITYDLHKLTVEAVRTQKNWAGHNSILAHAAMIQKYEPHRKPVDRVLEEARKIVAATCQNREYAEGYVAGDYDDHKAMRSAVAGIRRGMELAKESGA